jgi:hypothetical protein
MALVFDQTIIAMVWDFDKTLISTYMQKPLFEHFNVSEQQFWSENNQLLKLYEKQGINVNHETVYLNHLISYVQMGKMKGLNNELLRSFGKQLVFFNGLPHFFKEVKEMIETNPAYSTFNLKVEHYIVSTGLSEMIKGSAIYPFVDGIWGCEFIENPYLPFEDGLKLDETKENVITSIAYSIDNTTKTRAVFEINKGVNKHPSEISVNQRMQDDERRVPFNNMIYVADGPSDIPAFSVVKSNGGKALAVYSKGNDKSFDQANQLLVDGRVDYFSEADYEKGTSTYQWLIKQVKTMADNIVAKKKDSLLKGKGAVPGHIV